MHPKHVRYQTAPRADTHEREIKLGGGSLEIKGFAGSNGLKLHWN
jgi:hypothetical protein